MPWIDVIKGGERIDRLHIDQPVFYIGRDPGVDLVLPDAEVSRRHCRLIIRSGEYWVEDLGSTHGLFLNGRRVFSEPMNDGGLLQMGSYVLRYRKRLEEGLPVYDVGTNTDADIQADLLNTLPEEIARTTVINAGQSITERKHRLDQLHPHLLRQRPRPEAVYVLRWKELLIGSSPACHVRELATDVPEAAIIKFTGRYASIKKASRRAKIEINGLPINEAGLGEGDKLKIGRALFIFGRGVKSE